MESVLSWWLSWSESLPGSSAGLRVFQEPGLLSAPSGQLGLSEGLSNLYCLYTFGEGKGLVPGQFEGLCETIMSCLPPVLTSFLAGWNISVSP